MSSKDNQSIPALVNKVVTDIQRLVMAQLALAKDELSKASSRLPGVALFSLLALGCVSLATIFLLVTLAYVFVALGLPTWAGFLLVTLLLLAGGAGSALFAKKKFTELQRGSQLTLVEITRSAEAFTSKDPENTGT